MRCEFVAVKSGLKVNEGRKGKGREGRGRETRERVGQGNAGRGAPPPPAGHFKH